MTTKTQESYISLLDSFLSETKSLRNQISEIETYITSLELALQRQYVNLPFQNSNDVHIILPRINSASLAIANRLKELNAETFQIIKQCKTCNKGETCNYHGEGLFGTAEERIRTNSINVLRKKLSDNIINCSNIQTKYKKKTIETQIRQIHHINPNASNDEINEIINSGTNPYEYALKIPRNKRVVDALDEIQQRHNELLQLEKSITELHQLFLDMAILVDVQGEFLDTIEFNVSQSSANVTESVQNIKEANTLYDSIRKKRYF